VNDPIRVLVVDDQALLRGSFRALLDNEPGFTVVGEAATGVEAVALALELRPDVVLMDVRMPEMDGIEATRRIRALEEANGTPRTPIVALTANAFGEDRDACLAAGMDAFLVKPLDRERLGEILSAANRQPLAA